MNYKVLIAASLAAIISLAASANDPLPQGWLKAGEGAAAAKCQTYADSGVVKTSKRSLTLHCDKAENGFITVMQQFNAADYRGKRVRFSAQVKASAVSDWGGLWMRVDGKATAAFDNMNSRPIKGSSDWKRYDIVLDVAPDATNIAFGMLMSGSGQMWMDDLKIEAVENSVAVTDSFTQKKPNLNLN
ncbi:MAG: hypothetical protein V4488_25715 [Pseudomonadota bacterium]